MKIFISYSRADKPLVEKISEDLSKILSSRSNSTTINIWFDREIKGGHQWWSTILDVIEECDLFIFVLSSSSLASIPCRLERTHAHRLNKRILPLLVDSKLDLGLVPPELQLIHFVNYIERTIETYQNLQVAITNLPAPLSPPAEMPKRPDAPIGSLGQVKEKLQSSTLSREEQENILNVLIEHLTYPKERDRALILLTELKNHADVRGTILKDINLAIATNKAQPVLNVVNERLDDFKDLPEKMKPITSFVWWVWRHIRGLHPIVQFIALIVLVIAMFYAGYAAIGLGVVILGCVGPIWLLMVLWRFTHTKPNNQNT